MKKFAILAVSALALAAGCFKDKGAPPELPSVRSLDALAGATNKPEIVRALLRGGQGDIQPDAFAGFTALKVVDISERALQDVPEAVRGLATLEHLYLVRNELTSVPDFVFELPALTYLNLDGNRIAALPESLGKAKGLRWLRLNSNALAALPESAAALERLQRVYLAGNKFAAVPAALEGKKLLEDVVLDDNPVSEIPAWLGRLPSIRNLSFGGCRGVRLPEDLSGWDRLATLSLAGCGVPEAEMKRLRAAMPKTSIVF